MVATDSRDATVRDETGGVRKREGWTRLNGHRPNAETAKPWPKVARAVSLSRPHVSGAKAGVAGTYNVHSYSAEKTTALERWAAHVEGIVTGSRISSERSVAITSTRAPAEASSRAFQAAPALPPSTAARAPRSCRNTGSTASGANPPALVSTGRQTVVSGGDTQHLCQDALELGDAGTAIGTGTQCRAKRGDVACSRGDGGAASRPTPKQAHTTGPQSAPSGVRPDRAARRAAGASYSRREQGQERVPAWALGCGSDEERAGEPVRL